MKARSYLLIGLLAHMFLQVAPMISAAWNNQKGADFASYYYAVQATGAGVDPYNTAELGKLSREDGSRNSVNPYFYPPPFLLTMLWAKPLSLLASYRVMLVLNELLLAGCLLVLYFGFEVSAPIIALILAFWSPIPDHLRMGQANLLALFPAILGLWLSRKREITGGILVGIAGMIKMSPALFLIHFLLQRRWKAFGAAAVTAIGLSILSLPVVPFSQQFRFYREILPGFGSGDYNGLLVPMTLPANHSWPDLLNRAFPGDGHQLTPIAQTLSNLSLLAALAGWSYWFRDRDPSPKREGLALGALSVLMVALPVYTYEHHLVFLLLMVGAVGSVAQTTQRKILFGLCFFFLGWPLLWLRAVQQALPHFMETPLRESKFLAEVGFLWLCARWYRQP